MTLERVREFVIPLDLVDQTLEPLQDAGTSGYEAFVLWGGRLLSDEEDELPMSLPRFLDRVGDAAAPGSRWSRPRGGASKA